MKQQKAPLTRLDRILTGIGIALCVLLIPCLIVNVTMIIQSYVNEDEVPSFLGVTPLIVLSGSMEPKIHEGELIFSTDISPEDVREEMVISFFDPLSTTGTIVTHKVVEIIENEDGTRSFRTRGINNNANDSALVPEKNLVGRYRFGIPLAGYVAMFMQSTPGLVVCVAVPLVLFIGYDMLRRRKYDKSKSEDMDALMAELEALRAKQNTTDTDSTPKE
jgi:signal peptidase